VLAYDVAERMRADNRSAEGKFQPINRVILASDGVANVGANGPDAILDRIRGAAKSGIDLVTIGVGTASYNDEMMERLADGGNGFSAYVDAPFEADRLFRERLVSTLQTVARDAKVQVEFNPDVVTDYRLIGFENRAVADSDFRNDKVDAGEIGAGHSVTALYEVTLRDERRNDDIATVKLRWDDVRKNKVIEIKEKVQTSAVGTPLANANPRLGLSITVAAYAEVLRQGPWYRVTTLQDLAQQSRRLEVPLAGDPDVKEFIRLLDRAAAI
jgi:Ca-activated chloride channel homolog